MLRNLLREVVHGILRQDGIPVIAGSCSAPPRAWHLVLYLTIFALPAFGQYTGYSHSVAGTTVTLVFSATVSSNSNSNVISVAPSTFQHGNYATGCSGGVPTPLTAPVGQLYATSAIASTYSGVGGCPTQSFPTVTNSSGSRTTAATDNGNGAGGTDSATAFTDTFGANTEDSVCSGDASHSISSLFTGFSYAACVSNATAQFAETTAPSFGNADMLFLSFYGTNSTNMDSVNWIVDDTYFMPTAASTTHAIENDVGMVSSPNSYNSNSKENTVWGTQYSFTANMFQVCPQNCAGFVTLKACDITNPSSCITTYTVTNNHAIRVIWYDYRPPIAQCNPGSASACYCYKFFTLYDVTAAASPVTYSLTDVSGNPVCGTPVNQPTWASGAYIQNQIDMTAANASSAYYIISRTTSYLSIQ